MSEKEYRSAKSDSRFIVRGEPNRAYLLVSGEASTNAKVLRECERIRRGGASFDMACWVAREFARTY